MSVSLILKLTRGLATVLHPVPGIRLSFGLNPYSPQDPIDALTATSTTPAWYRCSKSSSAYEIERPIPKYRPATPISPTFRRTYTYFSLCKPHECPTIISTDRNVPPLKGSLYWLAPPWRCRHLSSCTRWAQRHLAPAGWICQ